MPLCSPVRLYRLLSVPVMASLAMAIALKPSAASAWGFTGDFDFDQWILYSYLEPPLSNDLPYVTESVTPNGATVFTGVIPPGPPYYPCENNSSSNCVQLPDPFPPLPDSAVIRGSERNTHGGQNERWATQWQLAYSGPDTTLDFTWYLTAPDGANSDSAYYYLITPDDALTVYALGSETSLSPTAVTVQLSQGSTFGFGVYTKDNMGFPGYLSISRFNPEPVPGPLPALGGAVAFAWSRRLRSRLRGRSI